jgi:hypothetical protein
MDSSINKQAASSTGTGLTGSNRIAAQQSTRKKIDRINKIILSNLYWVACLSCLSCSILLSVVVELLVH